MAVTLARIIYRNSKGVVFPWLQDIVSAAMTARQGARTRPHVRTLHGGVVAGSDPAPVRLPRAAEFPAALQRGADAADRGRAHRGGAAAIRAAALGPDPTLGQGPARLLAPDQCAHRIGE